MITILHGDDTAATANLVQHQLTQAAKKGHTVTRLSAVGLTPALLEQAVGGQSLFETQRVVILEGLLSQGRKAPDPRVIAILSQADPVIEIILVEYKQVSATQLRSFPEASVQVSKLPTILFTWLESFGVAPPTTLLSQWHTLCQLQAPEAVMTMMIRQIRSLLVVKVGGVSEGPAFVQQKLARQARGISLETLLKLHGLLCEIETQHKTGTAPVSLIQAIDLWLLQL